MLRALVIIIKKYYVNEFYGKMAMPKNANTNKKQQFSTIRPAIFAFFTCSLVFIQPCRGQVFGCQPQHADTHCYQLQGTGKCCFGDPLQANVSPDSVSFRIYNRTTNRFDPFSVENSHIERCVFILVHGHMSSTRAKWLSDIAKRINRVGQCLVQKNEFASSGPTRGIDTLQGTVVSYNTNLPHLMVPPTIIAIDWTRPAAPYYEQAAPNARAVGRAVGSILSSSQTFQSWRPKIHCIGQGLGAHICGIAGSVYGDFKRITGLDPSGPLFEESEDGINFHPSQRLDRSDAAFVDVIHTTAWMGVQAAIGHVDFYVNGYRNGSLIRHSQPQCNTEMDVNRTKLCSQNRAHEIFRDSFNKRCYFGKCSDAPRSMQVKKCEIGWRSYRCQQQGHVYCGITDVHPTTGETVCADIHGEEEQVASNPETVLILSSSEQPMEHDAPAGPTTRRAPSVTAEFLENPEITPKVHMRVSMTSTAQAKSAKHHHNRQSLEFKQQHQTQSPISLNRKMAATQRYVENYHTLLKKRLSSTTTSTSTTTITASSNPEPVKVKTTWYQPMEPSTTVRPRIVYPTPLSQSINQNIRKTELVHSVHSRPSAAISRFEKLRGNCRGIAIGSAPLELSIDGCAEACLQRPECAGFSYYIEHFGETAPCILKATGCPDPEPALFTFFRRLN